MSFFSKLFPFVNSRSYHRKPEEEYSEQNILKKQHESGTFSRESRVDHIEPPFCSILTVSSCQNEQTEEVTSVSSSFITRTLDRWNPETCVRLLRMPSVQNYSGLCKLISKSDRNWMIEFLDMGGLQVLFESVDRLSSKTSQATKLERTLLLLQGVKCLKAVVNSPIALEHIIRQRIYVNKIAEVLSSSNPLVKKQLFDFMSTLCIFSQEGHYLILDVFESYRVDHKLRYKFAVLLVEIKQAEVIPYVGAVLGLINCIILGACSFRFRTRIRNEFLALGLHDLLESLKHIPEEEVELQCSVFFKSQLADEEYARSMGIHSSFSHFALFQVLVDKIEDTPHSASFLVLLQNLNKLDPTDLKMDYVFNLLEEITERALNGSGSSLRNWMLSECRPNSLKSIATQTCSCVQSPLSYEDSVVFSKFSLCDEDCEKESVKSFSSHDSGVPVSRNLSFASNGPRSPDCIFFNHQFTPSVDKTLSAELDSDTNLLCPEFSGWTSENFENTEVDEKEKSKQSNSFIKQMGLSFNLTKETQTDLSKQKSHEILPESSTRSFRSVLPIPLNDHLVEEGKTKKTFSFSFLSRSKKYSLSKCSPTMKVTPLPETQHSTDNAILRNGMTSMDVKRSRKISNNPLNDKISINSGASSSSEQPSFNFCDLESKSSPVLKSKCTTSQSKEQDKLTMSTPDLSQNIPPPPPPPPPSGGTFRLKSLGIPTNGNLRSSWSGNPSVIKERMERKHNTLPMPKSKMKTLNWAKIPSAHVSVHSIWNEINQELEVPELNFEEMEKLFCQSELRRKETRIRQKKQETLKVSLLDSKRSLSIGVFLKQFKRGPEEVIEFITQFKHKEIGAERLKTLHNLLPDSNEVKLLNSYTGDINKLGIAEKFLLHLSNIDHYDCLVQAMLLQEEFPTTLQILHDSVQSFLDASQELLQNKGFKNFLKLVLVTGNFMNTGSYAGNAAGFRLSTLPNLLETKANRPRMTLLHYLVEETQRKDKDGIKFTNELLDKLNRCSRLTLESLSSEIAQLDKTVHKLDIQLKEENGKLKKYFSSLIENGIKHLTILKKKMEDINLLSAQLANRLCEDEKKFKLEECLNVVGVFCAKIKVADSENEARKTAEEKKIGGTLK